MIAKYVILADCIAPRLTPRGPTPELRRDDVASADDLGGPEQLARFLDRVPPFVREATDLEATQKRILLGSRPPVAPATAPCYVLGLDLGQASDYSALCAVERATAPDPAARTRLLRSFGVRHLQRWKLGAPYPQIVEDLHALARRPPLPNSYLALDATGVGRAVTDQIRSAKLPLRVVPIVITGGVHEGTSKGFRAVPKMNLAAVMQTLVQGRRFQVAPSLPDAKILGRELQNFRVKVTAAGNETFESWREREHDDLVLAVALACWPGSRESGGCLGGGPSPPVYSPPGGPGASSEDARLPGHPANDTDLRPGRTTTHISASEHKGDRQ